jgi:starch synthase
MIGILNGIDYNVWNPKTDSLIPSHFDAQSYESLLGKLANKRALLKEFGLDETRLDKPLLAMVSRIDVQKGFDLLTQILDDVLKRDISFVLLGTGDRKMEHSLREIVSRHPRRASMRFSYQEALSHLVIAGADIFLMPSKYEPCGLTQIYSMSYGTVPVVRATGGLADTVQEFDANSGKGTGFTFTRYDAVTFRDAIDRALHAWENRPLWKTIMRNGMSSDFGWTRSARVYLEAYEKLVAHR